MYPIAVQIIKDQSTLKNLQHLRAMQRGVQIIKDQSTLKNIREDNIWYAWVQIIKDQSTLKNTKYVENEVIRCKL